MYGSRRFRTALTQCGMIYQSLKLARQPTRVPAVVASEPTPRADAAKTGAIMAAAIGAWAGFVAARGAWRVLMRWLRLGVGFGRFWYLAGTLQLSRRCPDCRRVIVRDARVCRHCGWRR